MDYKLTYFNLRGKAELSRLLFCLSGQPFEDHRISREEWAKIKQESPFGQMPILEYKGTVLCQSKTIERFIAKRHGLCGKDEEEEAKCNMVVECIEDLLNPLYAWWWTDNSHVKEVMKDTYVKNPPQGLTRLEGMLNDNGLVLDQSIAWPDLALFLLAYCSWNQHRSYSERFSKNSKG